MSPAIWFYLMLKAMHFTLRPHFLFPKFARPTVNQNQTYDTSVNRLGGDSVRGEPPKATRNLDYFFVQLSIPKIQNTVANLIEMWTGINKWIIITDNLKKKWKADTGSQKHSISVENFMGQVVTNHHVDFSLFIHFSQVEITPAEVEISEIRRSMNKHKDLE